VAARVAIAVGSDDWAEPPLRAIAYRPAVGAEEELRVIEALEQLGGIAWRRLQSAEAEILLRRALSMREQALPEPPIETLKLLGDALRDRRRYEEAASLYERALALRREAGGAKDPRVAGLLDSLAAVRRDQGRIADAEALYRESLELREEVSDPGIAVTLAALGSLYRGAGELVRAELYFGRALGHIDRIKETGWWPLRSRSDLSGLHAIVLAEVAALSLQRGRSKEAESLLARSLSLARASHDPFAQARGLRLMATLEARRGNPSAAERHLRKALDAIPDALGDHPRRAEILLDLAALRQDEQRYRDAEDLLQQVERILRSSGPADDPALAQVLARLAAVRLLDAQASAGRR